MMLIRCPNCDSSHEVPASLLGDKPRKMRCAVCRSVFEATAADADSPPAPSAVFPSPPVAPSAGAEATSLDFDLDDPLIGEESPAPAASPLDQSAIDAAMSVDDIDALFDDPVVPPAAETAPVIPDEVPATPAPARAEADDALGAGAAAAAAAGAAVLASRQAPADAKDRKPSPHGRARSKRDGSGIRRTLGLVAATGFGTLLSLAIFRHETVRIAPSLAPAFEMFGLEVNSTGLEIHGVRSHILREDFRDTLEVTGQIINITRMRREIPLLRLSLHSEDGTQLYVWTATADAGEVGPGDKTLFRRRLASPPKDAHRVMVRFVSRDDIVASIR